MQFTFSPPKASMSIEARWSLSPVVILCCLRDSLWLTLSLYCCWRVSKWSWIYWKDIHIDVQVSHIISSSFSKRCLLAQIRSSIKINIKHPKEMVVNRFVFKISICFNGICCAGLATFLRLFCFWAKLCSAKWRASLASSTLLCLGFTICRQRMKCTDRGKISHPVSDKKFWNET